MVNGHCVCAAAQHGHSECYHRAAYRLIELYETAPRAVSRSELINDIKDIWPRIEPHLPLECELIARFGKNKLEMLDDDILRRVRLAISCD